MLRKICLLVTTLVLFASLAANACDCATKKNTCNCGSDYSCGCQDGK